MLCTSRSAWNPLVKCADTQALDTSLAAKQCEVQILGHSSPDKGVRVSSCRIRCGSRRAAVRGAFCGRAAVPDACRSVCSGIPAAGRARSRSCHGAPPGSSSGASNGGLASNGGPRLRCRSLACCVWSKAIGSSSHLPPWDQPAAGPTSCNSFTACAPAQPQQRCGSYSARRSGCEGWCCYCWAHGKRFP